MRGHDEYLEASVFGICASSLLSLLLPIITLAGRQDLDISGLHITADHRLAFVVNDRFATCSINGQNVRYLGTASAQGIAEFWSIKGSSLILYGNFTNGSDLYSLDLYSGQRKQVMRNVFFTLDQERNLLYTCQRISSNPVVDEWKIDKSGTVSKVRQLAKFRAGALLGWPEIADSGQALMLSAGPEDGPCYLYKLPVNSLSKRKLMRFDKFEDFAPA